MYRLVVCNKRCFHTRRSVPGPDYYVQSLVSCYVYCGGTKEEALDIVFVKKIFCKLKGREGDYIATGLSLLDEKIVNLYGKSAFRYTRAEIKKEIEKMEKAKKKGTNA